MQQEATSYSEWTTRFSTQEGGLEEIKRRRWPDGFVCPRGGPDHAYLWSRHSRHECANCSHQVSITAGTVFHRTKLPLPKWFTAIYFMTSDQGSISATRLSKLIEVHYESARLMLRKLRTAMGDRDQNDRLRGLVEVDDAYIGGQRAGKRGRGAEGKTPVLLAVERRDQGSAFLAAEVLETVHHEPVRRLSGVEYLV